MGADLYIESVFAANEEKYAAELARLLAKGISLRAREEEQCNKDNPDPVLEAEIILYDNQLEQIREKIQEEGYYRDSYNCSNLLWCYGLSYWSSFDKFVTLEGRLSVEGAVWLRDILEHTPFPVDEEYIKARKDYDGKSFFGLDCPDAESPESWVRYFIEKRKKLIAFLKRAIVLNEEIRWSV